MSWIPVFEFGWCNAWLLMLFVILHPLIMVLVDKIVGTGNIYQKMGDAPSNREQKKASQIPSLLIYLLFIYSIFLPLILGTIWLIAGLVIYTAGITMFLSAIITAAQTPSGQIFSKGSYRYSRHPLYISFLIIFVGVSVASASWLFFLLSMAWMTFPLRQVGAEERGCLEVFGYEYQEYMNRTHRWLGIPKAT